MIQRIPILLAVSDLPFRNFLALLFKTIPEFEALQEVDTAVELLKQLKEQRLEITVVITDTVLTDQPALKEIKAAYPTSRILLIGEPAAKNPLQEHFKSAHGFISRKGSVEMLLEAIRALHRGERYFENPSMNAPGQPGPQ